MDEIFFIKNSDSSKHFFYLFIFNKRSFNHILFSYQFQRIFANKNNILSKAYSFIHKNQPLISAYIIHVHFFNFFWACSFIHKKQFRTRMCYGLFCILLMLQFVCWNYEYHNHYNFFIKKLDSSKHFIYFFLTRKVLTIFYSPGNFKELLLIEITSYQKHAVSFIKMNCWL